MKKSHGGIIINEIECSPLGEHALSFIRSQKKESPFLDFKHTINISKHSSFPEIAKDIFAFSNYGGGWILIGWDEYKSSQFIPIGLSEDYELDPANLQTKFNSYSNCQINMEYLEFEYDFSILYQNLKPEIKKNLHINSKRFAAIFIPPSYDILKPIKKGEYIKGDKKRVVFEKEDVFYRRGTQSIVASSKERDLIQKRTLKESYRLSVLSGEPDEIDEEIKSNLFPLLDLPEYVYIADPKRYDDVSVKLLLKQEGIFPEFFHIFKYWNKKLVIFEDLNDVNNPYRKLVIPNTIKKEKVDDWMADHNRYRVINELLNKEFKHYVISNGIFYFKDKNKFFYPTNKISKSKSWKSRYRLSKLTVAAKMYASQLKKNIFWHVAFRGDIIKIGNEFYLRILPTFVISENGRNPVSSFTIGRVITRLSYNKYNSQYLNNILFWIYQIGKGSNIKIKNYLNISKEPVSLSLDVGIKFDIPSKEFAIKIEEESDGEEYEN